jgi:hypothetical protein
MLDLGQETMDISMKEGTVRARYMMFVFAKLSRERERKVYTMSWMSAVEVRVCNAHL